MPPAIHRDQSKEVAPGIFTGHGGLNSRSLCAWRRVKRAHFCETGGWQAVACGVLVPKFSATLVSSLRIFRRIQLLRGRAFYRTLSSHPIEQPTNRSSCDGPPPKAKRKHKFEWTRIQWFATCPELLLKRVSGRPHLSCRMVPRHHSQTPSS